MAIGDEARVLEALDTHLNAFTSASLGVLPIAKPNEGYDPKADGKKYLDVAYLPVERASPTLGRMKRIEGILQITVVFPQRTGIRAIKEVVSELIDHFYPTLKLWSGSVGVQIHSQPNERPPIYDDPEIRVPVHIPYQSFTS